MATVDAYYAVSGSTYRQVTVDTEGKTADEIAQLVDRQFGGISLCHQCSGDCQDPEGELVGFHVDGVEYSLVAGEWREGKR